MSIASALLMRANEIVASKQQRAAHLQRELADIEAQQLQKQMELDATRMAIQRGSNFRPMLGSDGQCPACFIEGKEGVAVSPIPSSEPHLDLFKCPTCKIEFSVEV